MKKIIACCLIVLMLTSTFVPLSAGADGTVVTITDAEGLYAFAERVNGGEAGLNAVLGADIVLADGYEPIGKNTSYPYSGEFDGKGYKITLNTTTAVEYAGVFGVVDVNGKISNLKTSGTVTGSTMAGGVAAYLKGTLYNCSSDATVTCPSDAGGIVGSTTSTSVTERCFASGAVTASTRYGGGIAGRSRGLITDCYFTGSVSGSSNIGGIAGAATTGTVKNSFCYMSKAVCGYKASGVTVDTCFYLGMGADGMGASAINFANGYVAHYLNTSTLSIVNRGLWAQGESYPVFADENNKPVYCVTFTVGAQKTTAYTKNDGTVDFPEMSEAELIWFCEGEPVDETTVVNGDVTFAGVSADAQTNAVSLVVSKDKNNIPYDIKPMYEGNSLYLFMPAVADMSCVNYDLLDSESNVVESVTADFTGEEEYTATFNYGEYKIIAMQSNLPAMFLEIDESHNTIDAMNSSPDHSISCYGDLALVVPDDLKEKYGWEDVKSKEDDEDTPGSMNMKGRGNSSWSSELGIKKAYQVKFEKKTSILGMDKSKKWCLMRDNSDLYKNALAFRLGDKLEMAYNCEAQFSDVYMNGDYLGTYLITDKIEIGGASVDITDLDDAFEENGEVVDENLDLTGGYLLEIDNTEDDLQFTASGNKFTIKGPEDLAKTATADGPYGYIIEKTSDLFAAIYGDGYLSDGTHFMEHIDMESFAQYFWIQELLGNKDCGSGSTYLYKDSDKVDPKFHAGPMWDHDYTLTQAEGWILPNLKRGNISTGTDTLYNALCDHKEFVSYLLYYYEKGIGEILKEAPQILEDVIKEVEASEVLNEARWGKDNTAASISNREVLSKRVAWLGENYSTITEFATKGEAVDLEEYIVKAYSAYGGTVEKSHSVARAGEKVTLTAKPDSDYAFVGWEVEEGSIELENESTVTFTMPAENVTVKAIYEDTVERDVIASYTFTQIRGSKYTGYTPDEGDAKIIVSANGTSKSDLRLNTDDFNGSAAVFSGTDTIPYGNEPYVDITVNTEKYDNIVFSADIGGKNAAPVSWKIMYSTDGLNYTELENSTFTLLKAGDMKEAYHNVKIPVGFCETAHIRLVAASTVTVDGGTFEGATFGEAAFDNINVCGVDMSDWLEEQMIHVSGTATEFEGKTILLLSSDKDLTDEYFLYAFYDENGNYLKSEKVPILKAEKDFYIVTDIVENAAYVRVFVWKDLLTIEPLSNVAEITIE